MTFQTAEDKLIQGLLNIYIDRGDISSDLVFICESDSIAESLKQQITDDHETVKRLKNLTADEFQHFAIMKWENGLKELKKELLENKK